MLLGFATEVKEGRNFGCLCLFVSEDKLFILNSCIADFFKTRSSASIKNRLNGKICNAVHEEE